MGTAGEEADATPGRLTQVAGAAGIGEAGDLAFALRLLDPGRTGGTPARAEQPSNGAKQWGTAGARVTQPVIAR
jgi:hypothetical protein